MQSNSYFVLEKYNDIDSLPIFETFDEKDYILEKLGNELYIPVARINLWQKFIDLTENQFKDKSELIFRGHIDPRWTLTPTLKRTHSSLTAKQVADILVIFRDALKDVKHGELQKLNSFNDNQLWALGRHYGLPTPLLDWTYDPLIALYFAYEDRANPFPYHSIYILNVQNMPTKYLSYFNNFPIQNEREKKQRGCYIKIADHNNLESIITKDKDSFTYFRKIYIKKNNPQLCLTELEKKYKISKLSLYPNSIEGAVEYCKTHIPSPYEGGGQLLLIKQNVISPAK